MRGSTMQMPRPCKKTGWKCPNRPSLQGVDTGKPRVDRPQLRADTRPHRGRGSTLLQQVDDHPTQDQGQPCHAQNAPIWDGHSRDL